ncbi:unnamed protein product [Adineta ricciae]|uniref:Uncharacterized protein n=1 Tax=Adineta ricciae TaxID=249248 RepID=A0A815S444_ADIRI|nr:unnamed protein product [Adineta ricciae]CAF1486851.1 unnamed protein product [Adineta ricciae]
MELHASANENNNIDPISSDSSQQNNVNTTTENELASDDESNESTNTKDEADSILSDDSDVSSYFPNDHNEEVDSSINNIKKSFLMFILQLRDDFLLPKNVTNIISTYIASLINRIEIL